MWGDSLPIKKWYRILKFLFRFWANGNNFCWQHCLLLGASVQCILRGVVVEETVIFAWRRLSSFAVDVADSNWTQDGVPFTLVRKLSGKWIIIQLEEKNYCDVFRGCNSCFNLRMICYSWFLEPTTKTILLHVFECLIQNNLTVNSTGYS